MDPVNERWFMDLVHGGFHVLYSPAVALHLVHSVGCCTQQRHMLFINYNYVHHLLIAENL